jgi:cytidylate kinase
VFILAPLPVRVERVMEIERLSKEAAEQRITGMDKLRIDYVRTFYNTAWDDPTHYHLVIDSGVWGESGTAELILKALEQMK